MNRFIKHRPLYRYALASLITALAYWALESVIHFFVLDQDPNVLKALIHSATNEAWMRASTSIIIFVLVLRVLVTSDRQVKRLEKIVTSALNSIREGVIICNTKNEVIYVNDSFSDLLGYKPSEVICKSPGMFSSGKHNKEFYINMWKTIQEQGF